MLKRMKHGVRITALAVGLATTASLAFFIGSFMADGTHEGTIGSGGTGTKTMPVAVNFPNGELTPTHPVPLTASVNNTTNKPVVLHHAEFKVTSPAPGCEASWFQVVPVAAENPRIDWETLIGGGSEKMTFPPGETQLGRSMASTESSWATFNLKMKDTGADQSACEGSSLKLTVHLSE